ncbi:MAG: protein kinase [Candidatus Magasanikbacteria bacterium]
MHKLISESDEGLSFSKNLKLSCDLLRAINKLWKINKVHRDIKPKNIIWDTKHEDFVLIDAGISFALDETPLTQSGKTVGTLPYMSPEQIKGQKKSLDFRSDMYSLGITVFESSTGFHPYLDRETTFRGIEDRIISDQVRLSDYKSDWPVAFTETVDQFLKKKAYLRPRSCEAVLETLSQIDYN